MKKAVTLLELLIVVIIVGILATIAVPRFTGIIEKVKWTEAVNTLGSIRMAAIIYEQEHEVRPQASFYAYLNGDVYEAGPNHQRVASWLDVEIPYPTQPVGKHRFIYALQIAGDPRVAWVHHEITGGDGFSSGVEGAISISYDGNLTSEGDAPNF